MMGLMDPIEVEYHTNAKKIKLVLANYRKYYIFQYLVYIHCSQNIVASPNDTDADLFPKLKNIQMRKITQMIYKALLYRYR